ncbi:TetR/AcrR family transcriptional regulator [Candidatus Leptofilum sp.]|uniref:TetR/AcrR family transcriptional regulator n=1 Tax=Candidatus Leptofilum sp. TaxID=3241576 RepID=UPI003B59AD2B
MTEHESKAHILATATAVFAEKGFAKASMNDIVRASGLSKGGVYWHFKSKNALITALFDQFFVGQLALLDAVLASEGTAVAKFTQLATLSGTETETLAAQFPSPLEFYALAAREEGLKTLLQTHFYSYQQKISSLVQQGIANGEFRDVDGDAIAKTFIALFEGALLVWAVSPELIDLSQDIETAVQHLLQGLQAK